MPHSLAPLKRPHVMTPSSTCGLLNVQNTQLPRMISEGSVLSRYQCRPGRSTSPPPVQCSRQPLRAVMTVAVIPPHRIHTESVAQPLRTHIAPPATTNNSAAAPAALNSHRQR